MADDDQWFGLDIPPHVQKLGRSRGLIAGAMDKPPPKLMADDLLLANGERLFHGQDILCQMVDELSQMASSSDEASSPSEYTADLCLQLVKSIRHDAADSDLSPVSIGHRLLVAGYLFGKLTMPTKESHAEATKHLIADIRRQTAFWHRDAERERGYQWMRLRACEIWEQDHNKGLRIGEVANMVRDDVVDETEKRQAQGDDGPRTHWPRSLNKIRKVIREVAPDSATKPGRPSKK